MRSRELPATLTDDRMRGPRTVVTDRGDWRVVRSPTRPTFHEGNQLSLDAPPRGEDLELWLERCRGELADLPIGRLLVQWEVVLGEDAGPAERVRAVMTARVSQVPAPADGVRLAAIAADDDRGWAKTTALHVADGMEHGGEPYAAFARTHFAAYRDLSRARLGITAWGAWVGDELAASCQVHAAPDWIRVEEVLTAPAFRRRGIAAALCGAAFAAAAQAQPDARLLIVADADSDAERLYARLGFVRTGLQCALDRPVR